jgi:hypothetical protein
MIPSSRKNFIAIYQKLKVMLNSVPSVTKKNDKKLELQFMLREELPRSKPNFKKKS